MDWQPPPSELNLPADAVHVWRAALATAPEHWAWLAADERARAERLRRAAERHRFVASRSVLRALLGRYCGVAPEHIRLGYGPHGKPHLIPLDLQFNLAHAGDWAIYAIARTTPLGVDMEHIRPLEGVAALASQWLAPAHTAQISAHTGLQQLELFFDYWTQHEAITKACGGGVGRPCAEAEWRVQTFTPAPDYCAALAYPQHAALSIHYFTFKEFT